MREGYKIDDFIWDGSIFFLLFNWEDINTVSLHGRTYPEKDNDQCIGVWKIKSK